MSCPFKGLIDASDRLHGLPLAARGHEHQDSGCIDAIDERIDAIDEGIDAIDERVDGIDEGIDAIDERVDGIDERIDGIDERIDAIDERIDGTDQRIAGIEPTRFGNSERPSSPDDPPKTIFRGSLGTTEARFGTWNP